MKKDENGFFVLMTGIAVLVVGAALSYMLLTKDYDLSELRALWSGDDFIEDPAPTQEETDFVEGDADFIEIEG